MVAWPDTIPCTFQIENNASGYGDGRIASPTDTGPGKVRRRSTAMAKPLSGTMIMDRTQLLRLIEFLDNEIIGGVGVFDFKDQITYETIQVRFALDQPLPTWTKMPGKKRYMVQINLEILP